MKKWLTSENAVTFGLMLGATILGIVLAPHVIGAINKAKSKVGA